MSYSLNAKTAKTFFLLGTALSFVSLNACSAAGDPSFFPSGYTHHGKIYKSKTPQPSQRVTNEQRASMGPVQAQQFRIAAYDILTRLTSRAGLPPKPAYIEAANPMTPFYANIDNDLREAMRSQGYRLADHPDGAYIFKYDAELLPGYRSYDLEKASTGAPNIQLTLDVMTDIQGTLKVLTHEVGNYYIEGAENLLLETPMQKYLPSENITTYTQEGEYTEPRTQNTFHSINKRQTIQPELDKTKPKMMVAPVISDEPPLITPSYIQPAPPPQIPDEINQQPEESISRYQPEEETVNLGQDIIMPPPPVTEYVPQLNEPLEMPKPLVAPPANKTPLSTMTNATAPEYSAKISDQDDNQIMFLLNQYSNAPIEEPMSPGSSEYVVRMADEPVVMEGESDVEIYDPSTSQVTEEYDYSASINEMSDSAPVRRGPRVSKALEY